MFIIFNCVVICNYNGLRILVSVSRLGTRECPSAGFFQDHFRYLIISVNGRYFVESFPIKLENVNVSKFYLLVTPSVVNAILLKVRIKVRSTIYTLAQCNISCKKLDLSFAAIY